MKHSFAASWQGTELKEAPWIAPARRYIFPTPVPGEEDILAHSSILIQIQPRVGSLFLAQCALGFQEPSVAHGLFATPDPDVLSVVAGGYAYVIDTLHPETTHQLPIRPVVQVLEAVEADALVFAGFHHLWVYEQGGSIWQTPRLSWEGLTSLTLAGKQLHGLGWDMHSDQEIPFTVNLETRACAGGGYRIA